MLVGGDQEREAARWGPRHPHTPLTGSLCRRFHAWETSWPSSPPCPFLDLSAECLPAGTCGWCLDWGPTRPLHHISKVLSTCAPSTRGQRHRKSTWGSTNYSPYFFQTLPSPCLPHRPSLEARGHSARVTSRPDPVSGPRWSTQTGPAAAELGGRRGRKRGLSVPAAEVTGSAGSQAASY